jgi:hypothetical protein
MTDPKSDDPIFLDEITGEQMAQKFAAVRQSLTDPNGFRTWEDPETALDVIQSVMAFLWSDHVSKNQPNQ